MIPSDFNLYQIIFLFFFFFSIRNYIIIANNNDDYTYRDTTPKLQGNQKYEYI